MIITDSASWEVVGRTTAGMQEVEQRREQLPKARLAGNGPVLAKRCNATDERFPARPKGVTQMLQSCVAAFEKDKPFPASCALTWSIWVALNP